MAGYRRHGSKQQGLKRRKRTAKSMPHKKKRNKIENKPTCTEEKPAVEVEEKSSSSESESEEEESAYQHLVLAVHSSSKKTTEENSDDDLDPVEEEDDEVSSDDDNDEKEHSDDDSNSHDVSNDDEDLNDQENAQNEEKSDSSDCDSDSDNDSDIINNASRKQGENASNNHKQDDIEESDDDDDGDSSDDDDGDVSEDDSTRSDDKAEKLGPENLDPFAVHFGGDLPDDFIEKITTSQAWVKEEGKIPAIGKCVIKKPQNIPEGFESRLLVKDGLPGYHIKQKLLHQLSSVNIKCVPGLDGSTTWTPFQKQMFATINKYQDVYYPMRDVKNGEEIRLVYCLHAVNHVLKTRSHIIAHNAKLKGKGELSTEEYRDQGLTRPKVLMVVPFRDSALRIVDIISNLLISKDQSFVSNKKRFQKEYSNSDEGSTSGNKPEDFEATFTGNVDDHFRMGLGVSKKSLKLYTDFYSSDIIIASPLGLRTIIGAEGEGERDYDFLSSIELLIFDQADVLLMQNWDHIGHIMSHLHLQPKESHGTDFSRVRMWTLNGWSKFYRQTLIYSSITCPEIMALFNKHCYNFAGKVMVTRPRTSGTISQVATQLPQVFQRIDCKLLSDLPDARLDYFFKKVVPHHKESVMAQTLVFIPSYLDYVRVRNRFKKEQIHCEFLCEYTNDKGVSRARHFFFHGNTAFMLYTERLHFYRRLQIRGVKHVVFYELPRYPHFYFELCNMLQDRKRKTKVDNMTCTVLFTRYEAQRLAEVVGTERASHMLNSQKTAHMFVTGDS